MNFELFYFDYALVFIGFKDFFNYSELKTVLADTCQLYYQEIEKKYFLRNIDLECGNRSQKPLLPNNK